MSYRGVGSYYEVPQPMGSYYEVPQPMGSYYEVPQPVAGMGSYFTFRPHEVMSGFGSIADTFSASEVWADLQIVNQCFPASNRPAGMSAGMCNNKSQQVNKAVQAALNELGYGPIAVDGSINWEGAYNRFLADFGLTKGPGYGLTQQALSVMEQELKAGNVPGPNPPVKYNKVDKNTYVPTKKPSEQIAAAGMGGAGLLLAALVVGGIGYAAYKSGQKKKRGGPRRTSGGRAMRLQRRR